ncbi:MULTISPECIES: hypothetical protein [Chromobacterium]|uniref:hypothetical protein n=1 Tax=Chromobacterium TaxID=535 RepID=UPI0018884AC4|nr:MULTISPECIES: hypothetical protein [Chromobacterium]WON83287.1 hypothetical protein OK026_19460 [Chromobacterium haemolyticum]
MNLGTVTTPQQLNPLIGDTCQDTLENLSTCLNRLGETLAASHADPSIYFFTASCAAALRFEAGRLGQR